MQNQEITFDDNGIVRSTRFGDIYFNPTDALGEIEHVFLQGNRLPHLWTETKTRHFIIAETGFGTGLNCLMAWALFEQTTQPDQHLHFISVEKYPLHKTHLTQALAPFRPKLGAQIDRLLDQYPLLVQGQHRIWLSDHVTLTLIFDEAVTGFRQINTAVDAWFLDGFAPNKNPDMWSEALFEQIGRLSHTQTCFATFTAAGAVKRGLQHAGFHVEKINGFGRKRDMLIGQFTQDNQRPLTLPKNVAIIGAGIAGASCAASFARRGVDVHVFEQNSAPAMGASGNSIGLINPKPSVGDTLTGTLTTDGFGFILRRLKDLSRDHDLGFLQNGTCHLANTPVKQQRFEKLLTQRKWHPDHMRLLNATEASDLLGTHISYDALVYPDGGQCNPKALTQALLTHKNITKHFNNAIQNINNIKKNYEKIIVCSGLSAISLLVPFGKTLPLQAMRGQTTLVRFHDKTIPMGIGYGGYCSATYTDGLAMIGATFDRTRESADILAEDDQENIKNFLIHCPDLGGQFDILGQWAGVRVTTPQRAPLFGHVTENISVCLALGSHGMTMSGVIAEKLLSVS